MVKIKKIFLKIKSIIKKIIFKVKGGEFKINKIFFIPSGNNKLTTNDINKGYLRITIKNKKYFPNEDCDNLIIIIKDTEYICKFRTRNKDGKNRSYTINLGKDLMKTLNIHPSSILTCQKIGDKKYSLSN